MSRNSASILRFGIVALSLSAAIAVYLFAREFPPVLLAPWQSADPGPAGHGAILGSAPSLFYTLALGLLIGACTPTVRRGRWHCLAWTGLASALEISQHSVIAKSVSALLADVAPGPVWQIVGPYWTRGVFDPLDLLATLVGGTIALFLLGYLTNENTT